MEPVEETEPTLCLEGSIGDVTEDWRNGASMVWPRGRMGGLEDGLVEMVSRELEKLSLKTMPCLRPPAGVLALELMLLEFVGVDRGGDLRGDIELKPRPTGVGRAEPVSVPAPAPLPVFVPAAVSSEELFVRKPCCVPYSVGSGDTALIVAWGFAGAVGLVRPGRYAVLRRLPAEVLYGIANLTGVPAPVPVGEADLISRSRPGDATVKGKSAVSIKGTEGREADGGRGRGGGRGREVSFGDCWRASMPAVRGRVESCPAVYIRTLL